MNNTVPARLYEKVSARLYGIYKPIHQELCMENCYVLCHKLSIPVTTSYLPLITSPCQCGIGNKLSYAIEF